MTLEWGTTDGTQALAWGGVILEWGVSVVVPDPGDVRFGVVYSSGSLPAAGDVRLGVVYG